MFNKGYLFLNNGRLLFNNARVFTGESASKTNAAMKAIRVAFSRIVALCVVGGNGIRTGFVLTLQRYDFFS